MKVTSMKVNHPEAVGVCRAIRNLLLIGAVALACGSSANAAISSGTITLNGATTGSLIITEGVSIALSATFTDSSPTNNDGAVVLWGDGTTNSGSVALANLGSNITVTASHQYATATAAPLTVTVTVTNGIGASSPGLTIASSGAIADAPLSFVLSTASVSVVEGNLASNVTVLTFFDGNLLAATNQYSVIGVANEFPGNVYTQAYSVVSAATTSSGVLFNVEGTLEYYSNVPAGSNMISLTVHELYTGGTNITGTGTVVIADAPLALVSTGVLAYTEGDVGPSNETLLTFIDSNTLATVGSIPDYVAVVMWGDGTMNTFTNSHSNLASNDTLVVGSIAITNLASVASNEFAVVGEHAYPTNGTYFVTIQVNDIGGAAPIIVSGIPDSVTDAGLTVVFVNSSLNTLPGFQSLAQYSLNPTGVELLAFVDSNEFASVPPISVAPYSFYLATINWGDGSATTTGTVTHVATNEFAVYGNYTYDSTCTNYPFVVKVLDITGGAFLVSTNSVIIQDAPIIGNGYTISAAANSTFSGTVAAFTDPDTALSASSFTATINWGDGTPYSSGTIVSYGSDVYLVQGTHSYIAAPLASEPVNVTVTDTNVCGAPVTFLPTTILFTGGSPGISFLYGLLSNYIAVTTDSSFTTNVATFTDSSLPPGDAFDLSALINWGDGSASDGIVTTNAANQYVVVGTHTYPDDGVYPVAVEVEDIDGNHSTLSNITIVAEAQVTDLTPSVEVLFGDLVKIKQYRSDGASSPYDYNYSEVVTIENISGATIAGPFGLVLNRTPFGANNLTLLNIMGQLTDGREYLPLSVDTLKAKGKLKVTLQWTGEALAGKGPVVLPIRLIAGPGL